MDYDSHFPAGYEADHTAGLRLLRVAARTRAEHGRHAVGPLYAAIGAQVFDTTADADQRPQLRGYCVEPDQIGIHEDWHAYSRRAAG